MSNNDHDTSNHIPAERRLEAAATLLARVALRLSGRKPCASSGGSQGETPDAEKPPCSQEPDREDTQNPEPGTEGARDSSGTA